MTQAATENQASSALADLSARVARIERRQSGGKAGVIAIAIGASLLCLPLVASSVELPTPVPSTGDPISAQAVWANFDALAAASVPPGVVVAFAGDASSVPDGWELCDGRDVPRDGTYANLFAAIGTAHGHGDEQTTFTLPDFRGRFLRGVDDPSGASAAGRDEDADLRLAASQGGNAGDRVGTVQGDAFASHAHQITSNSAGSQIGAIVESRGVPGLGYEQVATTLTEGGSESRPENAAVNFLIKL